MSLKMLTYEVTDNGVSEDATRESREPERREKGVSPAKMKALRKVAETALDDGTVFGTSARVGPATVRLTTNEYKLFQLWRQNWPTADTDEETRPDGAVVAAVDIQREEPAAYYCRQNGEVTLLNVSDYAQCRSWTLSMAADRAARDGWAGLQAAALELDGRGVVVACPDAALLAACAAVLALDYGAAVQNLTWTWLAADGPEQAALAHKAENITYLPPLSQRWEPRLGALAGGCSLAGLTAAGAGPVALQQFVLLEPDAEAEQVACEQVSPGQALNAMRKDHWYTPQLALPPRPGYRAVLEEAMAQARCLRAVAADGTQARALCQALAARLDDASA